MTKHTPGPWKCVTGNKARAFHYVSIRPVHPFIKGNPSPLASVVPYDWSEYGGGSGMANARLIAAAPELLDALQALYDAAVGTVDGPCIPLARAALAKATSDD